MSEFTDLVMVARSLSSHERKINRLSQQYHEAKIAIDFMTKGKADADDR